MTGDQRPPLDLTADELTDLAGEIERIDAEVRERLSGGEQERRRQAIMERVRRRQADS